MSIWADNLDDGRYTHVSEALEIAMSEDDSNALEDDAPEGGILSEDWLATIVGLAILALAIAGLIPKGLLW